jgi:hypothetical protein
MKVKIMLEIQQPVTYEIMDLDDYFDGLTWDELTEEQRNLVISDAIENANEERPFYSLLQVRKLS